MKIKHIGFIDEQVLLDLRRGKKVGSYVVYVTSSKYVRTKQKYFKKGNVTITWD